MLHLQSEGLCGPLSLVLVGLSAGALCAQPLFIHQELPIWGPYTKEVPMHSPRASPKGSQVLRLGGLSALHACRSRNMSEQDLMPRAASRARDEPSIHFPEGSQESQGADHFPEHSRSLPGAQCRLARLVSGSLTRHLLFSRRNHVSNGQRTF